MRRIVLLAAVFSAGMAACFPAWAQAPTPPAAGDHVNADEVIRKFAAKEAEFRKARENYTYRQSLKMEELDPSGKPLEPEPVPAEDRLPVEVTVLAADTLDAKAQLLDLLELAFEMESSPDEKPR